MLYLLPAGIEGQQGNEARHLEEEVEGDGHGGREGEGADGGHGGEGACGHPGVSTPVAPLGCAAALRPRAVPWVRGAGGTPVPTHPGGSR